MNFADKLNAAIQAKNSVVCVGLDPRLEQIPEAILKRAQEKHADPFEAAANAFLEFNKGIIDAIQDMVPAVKPQIAFYEQYGFHGMWAFEETCKYAKKKGLLVLADAKRGDIGSTAEAYAHAFLGEVEAFGELLPAPIQADALTVNAYLGFDGIRPFLKVAETQGKGIFVLVKTSNPSSGDLQDRVTADEGISIAQLMAHFVEAWGNDCIGESGYSCVGAVVGATFPKEAAKLRKLMPESIFLVPGYGAQGGDAEDVKACFNSDGLGALVNSSRGVIFAYQKQGGDYKEAARNAVIEMNADLNAVRGKA